MSYELKTSALRTTIAVPLNTASESPISTMIISEYLRRLRVFAPVPAPDLSSSFGSARETWSAGTRPMMTTHTTHADDPEREHPPARLRRDHPLGDARRNVRLEQLVGPERGQETEREARDGEQSALEEQLGDDVSPRRTERRPQRELSAASQSAGELQVGEIRAGDEQHREHRADQREVKTGEMELPILDRLEEEAGALERFAGRRGEQAEPT